MMRLIVLFLLFVCSCGVKIGNGNRDDAETPPTNRDDQPQPDKQDEQSPDASFVELARQESFFQAALSNICINPLPTLGAGVRSIVFNRGVDQKPWAFTITTSGNKATIYSETSGITSELIKDTALRVNVLDGYTIQNISCTPRNKNEALLEVVSTHEQRVISFIAKRGELIQVVLSNPKSTDRIDVGEVSVKEKR